jgi:prepilin-type processing-associated H-X9-DG protein
LPYIEQNAAYEQYKASGVVWVMDTPPAIKDMVISALMCPSDGAGPAFGGGGGERSGGKGFQGNYVVCTGDAVMRLNTTEMRGLFWNASRTKFANVTDGTSNTLLASEVIIRGSANTGGWGGGGGYWGGGAWGSYGYTAYEPPNTTVSDRIYKCKSTTFPQSPCQSDSGSAGTAEIYARSYHPGGVMTAFADGSVRFLSETINLTTYRALATRAQGETVPNNF